MKASVKHCYKDIVFLFNPDFHSTEGVVVEKANNCILVTAHH